MSDPISDLAVVAPKEVFVSYARKDYDRVLPVVAALEAAGVAIWRDEQNIVGGECYGPAIVSAIKNAKVLLLMSSSASMRSKNVSQEIRLAWHSNVPYLPLRLERIDYSDQVAYWLGGTQWVDILDRPREAWLGDVIVALERAGVRTSAPARQAANAKAAAPVVRLDPGLEGLRIAASFTDEIWPVPADAMERGLRRVAMRGLGAPQPSVRHRFSLGSRVRLVIEMAREGHLTLINEGPEGTIYCLCPSWFAKSARLASGQNVFPQPASPFDAFIITGRPGREQILAIITEEPLGLNWMTPDPDVPARTLNQQDLADLTEKLQQLPMDRWYALSTYFDVTTA